MSLSMVRRAAETRPGLQISIATPPERQLAPRQLLLNRLVVHLTSADARSRRAASLPPPVLFMAGAMPQGLSGLRRFGHA
jgi:hypothetical protein